MIHNFKIDKKFWTYDNLTGEDYEVHRSKPAYYIKKAIEIAKYLNMKTVVEIGSTRFAVTQKCVDYYNSENNPYLSPPCCCDGHGGFFWTEAGFDVYTVDIDVNCLNGINWSYSNLGREIPNNLNIMIPKDGIEFLNEFPEKIDVLFLDGWDKGTPMYAEKHLEAYLSAKDKLSDTNLILIDDTDYITKDGGKDALLSRLLLDEGYIPLFNGRQTLFLKYDKDNTSEKKYDSKVILSLTTIPNRLNSPHINGGLKQVLDKILNLSYNNYEIHLNIPYVCKKINEEYVIPNWLTDIKDEKLKIFRTEDYGSLTKLVPTLLRTDVSEDIIIITIDDDLEYIDGFIEYHLMKREQYPNAALGFAGIGALNGTCHYCTTVKEDVRVKILEGYKTSSYRRNFFKEDFFDEFLNESWNDDMIISAYLGKYNIEKWVMNYNKDIDFSARVESFPVVGSLPNERGGCWWYRSESTDDNSNKYYKLQYLER